MTPASVRRQVRLPIRLPGGEPVRARVYTFDGLDDGREHLVVALGDRVLEPRPGPPAVPLVRLHSECLTGDVLGSLRCDCGPQLRRGRHPDPRRPAATWSTCGRRGGASGSTTRSTRTPCRTRASTRSRPTGARVRRRRAQLRRRGADAAGPRRRADRPAHQQPRQGRPAAGGRGPGGAVPADGAAPVRGQRALPRREGRPRAPDARARPEGAGRARRHTTARAGWRGPWLGEPVVRQAARSGSPSRRSRCSASRSSWRTRSAEMPCLRPMSASLCWRPSTSP